MNDEMELEFRNPTIVSMLMTAELHSLMMHISPQLFKELDPPPQVCGEDIIAGYWMDQFSIAVEALPSDQRADFTYDTVDRLPAVMTEVYCHNRSIGHPDEMVAELVGKTLAAYLFGLAMNEHGYDLTVEFGEDDPVWGPCFRIMLEAEHRMDFLAPVLKAVNIIEGGLFIRSIPIIETYKQAVGKDLGECGLPDIAILVPEEDKPQRSLPDLRSAFLYGSAE